MDEGAKLRIKCPDGIKELTSEKILVAVGRAPFTQELEPEKSGIVTDRGFIQTDDRMQTSVNGVYAIGDCTGKLMLAHAAMAMGPIHVFQLRS